MSDDTPFLITGWVTFLPGIRYGCLWRKESWLYDCVRARFSDVAGAEDQVMTDAVTFRFIDDAVVGPVVVSVHVHDRRAAECGSAVADCDRLMVVDRIVLSGDEAYEPGPLAAEQLRRVLGRVQHSEDLTLFGPDSREPACGDALPGAQIYFPSPKPKYVPAVTMVEIEPSATARARALSQGTGPASALGASALICSNFASVGGSTVTTDYRLLAIENVVVLVQVHHGTNASDRAFLIRLAKAMQHAAE